MKRIAFFIGRAIISKVLRLFYVFVTILNYESGLRLVA